MKIAILTYQYAINYGAALQAYALKSYLEQLGHDVDILNYDTSYLYLKKRSIKARIVSAGWNCIKAILGGKRKRRNFSEFQKKKLKLKNPTIKDKKELEKFIEQEKYDAIIVGSDQVWNPEINGGDDAYYLKLKYGGVKISYAASFGVDSLKEEDLIKIKDSLESFRAISVREVTGKKILEGLDKTVEEVLDPVFLPDVEKWDELAGKRIINDKYLLCYVMPGNRDIENKIENIAKQYKKENNGKVVYLGRKEYKKFKRDGKDIVAASPEEFVNLFKYADKIVTNSFHGTAFSIIYSKQFYSVIDSKQEGRKQLGSRIKDLLHKLNLNERLLEPMDECDWNKNIIFEPVIQELFKIKKESKAFLDENLK